MANELITTKFLTLWRHTQGLGSTMKPFSVVAGKPMRHGMTDINLPSTGRTPVFGFDAFNRIIQKLLFETPPGGLPNSTITFNGINGIDYLEQKHNNQENFYLQVRYVNCGLRNNPVAWDYILAFNDTHISNLAISAGPNLDGTDSEQIYTATIDFSFNYIKLLRDVLSALTTTQTEDYLSIGTVEGIQNCVDGFAGIDKVFFFGGDDTGAAVSTIEYTTNGGSTIAAIGTDPSPFTQFVGISAVFGFPLNKTQIRIIAAAQGIAGTAAQFAYADVTTPGYGTSITVAAWTGVSIADAADPDGIAAMIYAGAATIYIATWGAGDMGIYVSTDFGATDPGSPVYEGTVQPYQLKEAPDGRIWCVGASNLLLVGDCNEFVSKTGPEAATNYCIDVAENGAVFIGNDTSIWRSDNVDAGTWTEKKDFGANHRVVDIHCVKGSSEIVRCVVTDSTATEGDEWLSVDGGATWEETTNLTNTGYTAAYYSKDGLNDGNLAYIVGPQDAGGLGTIHKLASPVSGC